jgi:hypothetical protein
MSRTRPKLKSQTNQNSETIRVELQELHDAQQQVVRESKRFNVLACGRRWGKSTLGIDRLTHPVLDGKPVGWFAPTNKSLNESWEFAKLTMRQIITRKQEDKKILEFIGGGKMEMWSLEDPDGCRGRKYASVVVDEAAHVKDLEYAWSMVIRPTLTDMIGTGWFLSTPNGLNYFNKMFNDGRDPLNKAWASWQMPSRSNPYLLLSEIEDARRDLSEAGFAQEYEAQFVNWEGAAFRCVMECATATPQSGPIAEHEYVFGVDWGRISDPTAIGIIDTNLRACVAMERWQVVPWGVQLERIKHLRDKWQPRTIIAEENSMGGPLIEALQRAGLPVKAFVTTNASKADAVESLGLAFEQGELTIIPDPVLLSELLAFQAVKLPSGLMRYEHPPRQHDDTVIALAMAYHALGKRRQFARLIIGGLTKPTALPSMAGSPIG